MARITDWDGITKTRTGYLVRVHVRPFPMKAKRFPRETPHAVLIDWRDTTKRRLQKARPPRGPVGTFRADVARYLEQWGAGKHPITVLQRTRYLGLWADVFDTEPRALVTTADIERQLQLWRQRGLPVGDHARRRKRGGKPLTEATIRKVRQAIYQLYAVLDRGTDQPNPVAAVPAGSDPEPDPRGLSQAVVRAILAHLPRSKTKARSYVVAYIGLRPPLEVARLAPGDWKGRTLFVRSGKGSSRETVPLTRRGAAALRYFARLGAWGPCTSAPWNRMLKAAARAALADEKTPPAIAAALRTALPTLTAYSLRHSFGTWHYQATHDIQATKAAMRHKTLRMTERYTRAAVAPALQESIATLDAAFRRRA